MDIKLIRNKDCHIWEKAEEALINALKEANLPQKYSIVLVKSEADVQKHNFYGSPQITIDGNDIDPSARKITNYQVKRM